MFLLKLLLSASAMNVPGSVLSIIDFIDEIKWCSSYTDLAQKYVIYL